MTTTTVATAARKSRYIVSRVRVGGALGEMYTYVHVRVSLAINPYVINPLRSFDDRVLHTHAFNSHTRQI